MEWDTVIGLEIHAQLKTVSKLFSGAPTDFGAKANTQTSFIDAGLPGVLPVLNKQAVFLAVRFGLAIDGEINNFSTFERKNYFYPDLPKGYQISQYQRPIISNGYLLINEGFKNQKQILISRAHLEEDAGKSIHNIHNHYTGIDLNRAGTPLLEIVTAPCMNSADEAISFLKKLHLLVRFLDICDGNMQEGSFRCDVNLSLKPKGSEKFGTRAELKNLNSFRFIEKAILYEQARQQELLENGQPVLAQTRLFCPETGTTQLLRKKETEADYRYFPDPDLLPIHITSEDIEKIKNNMPDRPECIRAEMAKNPLMTEEDIQFILSSPAVYRFFIAIRGQTKADEKLIINWLKGQYTAALNETHHNFEKPPVAASQMAALLNLLTEKKINHHMAKIIFSRLWAGETNVEKIMETEGFQQQDDDLHLRKLIQDTIKKYPQQAADYKAGKEKLLAFFVGQIMKQSKGTANPEQVNQLFKEELKK
ncbi:Asp-tRNA(Asn)/Glu-tRNA(Gln) amidotransferase subunit GatB [Legionella israelensis]|uniref:Aspartyl/glutamyl-tRNA(Asn/Gln) amidotransferase subunit B n=1 Tax=Legionella israelensis TaxID=454 RepID=A0A0W0W3X1_9GAMM|nr:Asp-tRNA(Asn)/Glu-tRNA(Gln) amidotransferase subunit GatB [Legionella israelensis]KTD26894.1 aspartyl/glutamyl-tRNA amidotransferase subunit B [Legionella israelensis]QBS08560.1 Asp-tRNA(Asn)/Glu-tRNA(Gln) amidotransferase subunit GatB [Legionella israelensis]SCX76125.1 aspartyl/glutamyl-tRNA(Asn/Gln) amidotransferase subunit B [Legionella israelensis DSM 19235]STX58212.1 aspartyl-tRNA(Asn)/glutamyl-tRNA (Gln) amidotransferase subunit B [Legionella israelensis]